MKFSRINEIVVNAEASWKGHAFLTFDLDWCSDAVLEDTINMVEDANCAATWFVTHRTPLLQRLRANPLFELGIHPNFSPLLEGDTRYGRNPAEVVAFWRDLVPRAVSVRSHSMTQNSRIQGLFAAAGLQQDCNHFIPATAGIALKPWTLWDCPMTKVPHHWEDDVSCLAGWRFEPEPYLSPEAINVFAFHPIHVALNTEHISRYENSRELHQGDIADLQQAANQEGPGTRTFLHQLLALRH